MRLNGTVVSSSDNLHPYKVLLEVDLSSGAQYKQGFLACQVYEYEDDPTKFQDSIKLYFRNRYGTCKISTKLEISFPTQRCIYDGFRQKSVNWG